MYGCAKPVRLLDPSQCAFHVKNRQLRNRSEQQATVGIPVYPKMTTEQRQKYQYPRLHKRAPAQLFKLDGKDQNSRARD